MCTAYIFQEVGSIWTVGIDGNQWLGGDLNWWAVKPIEDGSDISFCRIQLNIHV